MSTVGFNDVFNSSLPVLLSKAPDLVVNVASLPGLSILKLISWQDAYPLRRRDAEDFFQILYSYMDAGNLDRLPTDAKDLVGDAPPPLEILGAELLGRDMREISGGTTAAIIGRLLEVETATDDRLQLLGDMVPAAGPTTSEDELFALLVALRKGFEERRRDVS
jgi:predicted nucleotidyltransferase